MPVITLPDGSQRHFDHAVSPMDVAPTSVPTRESDHRGPCERELVDASDLIENDAQLSIITAKDEEGLRSFVTCAPVRSCHQTAVQTPKWRSARLSTTASTTTLTLTTP